MRVIHVLRKPLGEASVGANVLKHGCAALHVDVCRVAAPEGASPAAHRRATARKTGNAPMMQTTLGYQKAREAEADGRLGRRGDPAVYMAERPSEQLGRWPANLVLEHRPACRQVGTRRVRTGVAVNRNRAGTDRFSNLYGDGMIEAGTDQGYADEDGREAVDAWACTEDCPVADLDGQTGVLQSGSGTVKRATGADREGNAGAAYGAESRPSGAEQIWYGDEGGASRFFKQVGGQGE